MKKSTALLIAFMMIICSVITLFNNVVYATNEEVVPANTVDGDPVVGPGAEPDAEPPATGDDAVQSRTVDFGDAQWTFGDTVVTVQMDNVEVLNNGPVEIAINDIIRVNNFDPETMQITVRAEDGFTMHLDIVSEDNETTLECNDVQEGGGIPNPLTFTVEGKRTRHTTTAK